jgi:hypothetical protein
MIGADFLTNSHPTERYVNRKALSALWRQRHVRNTELHRVWLEH